MKNEIKKLLEKAILTQFGDGFAMPEISVERTKDEQFGDYTTNIAMVLGKSLKKNPMEVADQMGILLNGYIDKNPSVRGGHLPLEKGEKSSPFEKGGMRPARIATRIVAGGGIFAKIDAVKPGYINFYLAPKYFQDKVAEINKQENKFGSSEIGKGVKVNNEFISANPTGPLHLGNGRGGFFGDTITNVLRKAGYDVTNEYYVNDAGEQVLKLGHSVLKDSEAIYTGEYIDALNKQFGKLGDVKEVGEKAAEEIMNKIVKKTVAKEMKINFDQWVLEKKLYDEGYADRAIEMLKNKKLTFEEEGALWLRTTEFGDDKDRVLIKGDGQKTYFASDCGYILYKMERGFDKFIEIWGADHHGYIERFKAAAKALGFEGELKFVIVQLVRLVKDGKEVRMSKRAGNVVYIDDLIDEVGHDVARFFFLMYSPDTHMNFDLGLAKEQSQKNPVFYVQYAYARVCNILGKASEGSTFGGRLNLLVHEKEISLIRELDKFPELLVELSESYEVHKLPHYALKLADKFHSFYDVCRVIDEENPELTSARLSLVNAVKIVLGEVLRLMGVNAPEKM